MVRSRVSGKVVVEGESKRDDIQKSTDTAIWSIGFITI